MNDTRTSRRPAAWWVFAAVIAAAAIWATVAMASGGSTGTAGSAGSDWSNVPAASTVDPQGLFLADDGAATGDDCPGHGGGSDGNGGSGGSTTPPGPSAPTTPSTPTPQDGSSNPGL